VIVWSWIKVKHWVKLNAFSCLNCCFPFKFLFVVVWVQLIQVPLYACIYLNTSACTLQVLMVHVKNKKECHDMRIHFFKMTWEFNSNFDFECNWLKAYLASIYACMVFRCHNFVKHIGTEKKDNFPAFCFYVYC
jgi:hypothetical protein